MTHHTATVAGIEVESDRDFVVLRPGGEVVAECSSLAAAKRALRDKLAEANECNVLSDLAIFRWSDGKWVPAVSLYEIQEWNLEKNPTRVIHFP